MLKPDYIVGLVDGEGSFTVYIRNPDSREKRKRRVKIEPKFNLKLIEKDKDILYDVKSFFRCGNVYFQKDNRKNHQNCYRYEVTKRNDLVGKIIPFFDKYQLKLVSKRKDFKIFSAIMEEIKKNKHLTKSGLRKLYFFKRKMH